MNVDIDTYRMRVGCHCASYHGIVVKQHIRLCPDGMMSVIICTTLLLVGGWYVIHTNYIDTIKCIQWCTGLTTMFQSGLQRNDPLKYFLIILLLSGDIHENSIDTVVKNLSLCHINVQSIIYNKLDLITVELSKFVIMTLSKTWLDETIKTPDLLLPSYLSLIRLDRNRHGGDDAMYIKYIPVIDRTDLIMSKSRGRLDWTQLV